jgi:hypothetical protein
MAADGATPIEARALAEAFRALSEWAFGGTAGATNEVVLLVRRHLEPARLEESVVTRALPAYEHVNLQAALDRWMAVAGRTVTVRGFSLPPHYGGLDLQQLLTGEGLPPVRLSAPGLVDLPSGPDRTLACLQRALLLVDDARGSYVVMVRGPERHEEPELAVEVAGLAVPEAQAVLEELAALRAELNVYRGQVVELHPDPAGGVAIDFVTLPRTRREEVVLPETVLHRIERHTVDVARHRAQLQAAGQHLKRGLLLYGPPGTGKTHTTRYVVGRLAGSTVLLLSGRSLALIGAVAGLARELQPAVVVLEDVDLVAEDRGFGPGSSPVLFELLDAMDGAAADADLLFLLTTNRADLLEPALAARPGRVDVAVEIGLPDAEARRRLLELYGRGVPLRLQPSDVETAVERTAGTTASFIKELLRRSVLEALAESDVLGEVTGAHLGRALDDLLDSNQQVTRALLGVEPAGTARSAGGHGGLPFEDQQDMADLD